jgi:hypothetical protein
MRFLHLLLASTALFVTTSHSFAAYDPCNFQVNLVTRAERNVQIAENNLFRAENNLLNVSNSLSLQLANLQANVELAAANANAAGAAPAGNAAGCAISGLFGFGRIGGCIGRSIAAGIAVTARANANLRAAQGRYQSFAAYAESRLNRDRLRVVAAQDNLEKSRAALVIALGTLATCRAANPLS